MLLTGKNWRAADSVKITDSDSLIKVLLKNRGITDEAAIEQFLSDNPDVWYDPYLFRDMNKAVDLVVEAISNKQKILVYGDYDCDGVTATSILVKYFKSHNCDVEYIVPHRAEHGYGLTDNILDKVLEYNPSLLITVDCGITNIDTVKEIKSRGIKVIVTDHHNVKEELPEADAVICAKRVDNTYPFTDLCGAGVALKLVEALGRDGRYKLTQNVWRQAIEMAGIATIADLVSVVDENRTLVKKAFQSMKDEPANTGVKVMNKMLLDSGKTLDETFISFNFVPRVNAAGRLYDSSDALRLFLAENDEEAKLASENLTRENDERKEIEAKVFEEAVAQLENPKRPDEWSIANTVGPLVCYGSNWHQGVLGIVAGKLSQHFRRSAIVFTDDTIDSGNVKGSGRAFGDFDLFGTLENITDSLANFGGHKKAAGMVVKKTDLGKFMKTLEDYVSTHQDENSEEDTNDDVLDIDCEIGFANVTYDTYKKVCGLKPFGIGNTKPVFVTKNLVVSDIKPMSDGAHMRLELIDGNNESGTVQGKGGRKSLSAVGFGMGEYLNVLKIGDKVDIAYTMNEFCFRGECTLSLHLNDIVPVYPESFAWNKADIAEKLYHSGLGVDQIAKMAPGENITEKLIPTNDHYMTIYRVLSKFADRSNTTADIKLLAKLVSNKSGMDVTPFQMRRCLDVFAEAGLIKLGIPSTMRVCFTMKEASGKPTLSATDTYKRLNRT